ncbi:MAG: hypothetical protein FJ255_11860, partial [Phycisphaerae bacterium]|nr:hypothetical protein [Phycisphaerae bacterium]
MNRTLQRWHSELMGGLSAYEKERRTRTEVSRYRKTKAELAEPLFLRFDKAPALPVSMCAWMFPAQSMLPISWVCDRIVACDPGPPTVPPTL